MESLVIVAAFPESNMSILHVLKVWLALRWSSSVDKAWLIPYYQSKALQVSIHAGSVRALPGQVWPLWVGRVSVLIPLYSLSTWRALRKRDFDSWAASVEGMQPPLCALFIFTLPGLQPVSLHSHPTTANATTLKCLSATNQWFLLRLN